MFKAAVIQMVSGAVVEDNLKDAAELIGQAAAQGARLLSLPENFALMAKHERDKIAFAENFGQGPIQDFLAAQARAHGVWLVGGSVLLRASVAEKVRAACLLYDPGGQCVARYDKIHLFDVTVAGSGERYRESATFEPGDQTVVAATPLGHIGLSVCYDLRFPELYRAMHQDQVNIISAPSAFTATTGAAHWETLLRSRAIENLAYVMAPNQGGRHADERSTWGHSMIVDPWGEILAEVEPGSGFAVAEIDPDQQARLRRDFPCIQHRAPDLCHR